MSGRKGKKRNNVNKKTKVSNAMLASPNGAGGVQDQGARRQINNNTSNPVDDGALSFNGARWIEMYRKEWTAQKIVDIPVGDMLRNGWEYEGLEEGEELRVNTNLLKLDFNRSLRSCLTLERLTGGCVMFMGVKDDVDDPSVPLDPTSVDQGDLAFVNVIPRNRVSVTEFDNDPLSATYGHPMVYLVNDQDVHESRLIIFDGDPLLRNMNALDGFINRNDSFGDSVLAPVWDDIVRSIGSRAGAAHLIDRASVLVIINQALLAQSEAKAGEQAIAKLDSLADQLSLYGAAMVDGKNTNLEQWNANFGSVPELLEKFLQIISAGSDIPATRFLGQAPGGLNATGTSDLENYYNMIDARRETGLRHKLDKFFNVQMRSVFGNQFRPEMLELEFKPLWNMSETELSTIRSQDTVNVVSLVNSGMVSANEGMEELQAKDAWETDLPSEDLGQGLDLLEEEETQTADEILQELSAIGASEVIA